MAFQFITYLTVAFFTIAFLSLGVAGYINTAAQDGITSTGMTGIEALIFGNIPIIILFAMALGIFAFIYFGG